MSNISEAYKCQLRPLDLTATIFSVSENPTVEVSSSYLQKCGFFFARRPVILSDRKLESTDSHFIQHSRKNLIAMPLWMTYSLTVSWGGAASQKL